MLTQALKHNKFFKELKNNISETAFKIILKEMKVETFQKMQTIFNFGDRGRKFYIVLSGEVFIMVPSEKKVIDHYHMKQKGYEN